MAPESLSSESMATGSTVTGSTVTESTATENIKNRLVQVVENRHLSEQQMSVIMRHIMTGQVAPEQVAAFLTAMRMKGVTVDEVTGAVTVMRSLAQSVNVTLPNAIDIVGTGGDGASLFNVSTAAAFICAAAGVCVAKHGNYGFSSSSGSADVLKAAGVNLLLNAAQVQQCIEQLGVGFMCAPQYHAAMRHVAPIRKALGFRTFMNIMGPLTNPAGVKRQLTGVYDKSLCRLVAEVLAKTGSEHVMVVHSDDGLDEISPVAPTFVVEYNAGRINEYTIHPTDFGITHNTLQGLAVKGPEASLALIREALGGGTLSSDRQKAADMLALNAGAAIYVADKEASLAAGIKRAQSVIESGQALARIEALATFSNGA